MIHWNPITDLSQIDKLKEESNRQVVVIFKHSTTCPISSMAKMRLESAWNFPENEVKPYYLDLLAHRNISNNIAETFAVHHESPQLIVLKNGESFYDVSHMDISVSDLKESLDYENGQ